MIAANMTEDTAIDTTVPVPETTRVFVSGLPPTFTSDQLAAHFATHFKVTDAHVLADRRIGFVGFVDSTAAQNATKHFNRTYVRMSRIAVDLAKPVELSHGNGKNGVPLSHKNHRVNTREQGPKRKRTQEDDGEQLRNKSVPKPGSLRGDSGQSDPSVEKPVDEPVIDNPTDMDWMRGRTTRTLDLIDPDQIQIRQDEETEKPGVHVDPNPAEGKEIDDEVPDLITKVPNARLFLRNLAFSITEQDLRQHFEQFGKVQEAHLVKDTRNAVKKGTAFVQFSEPSEAESALQKSDGITLQGRLLHILPASDKKDKGLTEFDISQMPLKKQKAVRRKLDAAKQSFSWNSLYMNPDAVISSIADRLGVSKADILDPTSADAAVKQAHAETQLIKETKQYLASAGVNVDAFKVSARDDRCLLLKNFPYGTSEIDLRALLEPFGALTSFVLPPAGTMALVQFQESYAAAEALKGLAYKNIKGSVLYLEKAPQGILAQPLEPTKKHEPLKEQASDVNAGQTSTVFVKNLNFATTTVRLQEIASTLPGFVTARVKTRTDAKRPGEVLSMGFGFLEFRSKEQAQSAVKALSGHRLDGHDLVVQLSSRATDAGEETRKQDKQRKKDANQTKIIIKNLPFQTSKKDIRSLFAQYGELKMVRVPRKFDNSTRGFAFAEFVTPKEAENAMDALANTHLLGRRLVLDFAEGDDIDPEEEIRAIEKKVDQQSRRVHLNSLKGPGRKKFNLETAKDDDFLV